jgi:hypothetical protein
MGVDFLLTLYVKRTETWGHGTFTGFVHQSSLRDWFLFLALTQRLRAGLHSFAALRLEETREQTERSPPISIDVQATEKWGTSRLS